MLNGQTPPASPSKKFRVEWEIDIQGVATPEEAARNAWEHMRRYDSTANVFTVYDEAGNPTKVDLQEVAEADGTASLAYPGGLITVALAVREAAQLHQHSLDEKASLAAAQAALAAAQGAFKTALEMLLDHAVPDNWAEADELSPEHVEAWRNGLALLNRLPYPP